MVAITGIVGTATIGFDHVDLDYLHTHNIGFASAPGSNANSAAEYVIAALLEIARRHAVRLDGRSIGVIGVGNMGQHHARIYASSPGSVLVGVADTNLQRAEEIASRYGVEAFIIDPLHPDRQIHLLDGLSRLLDRLEPVAVRLGCADELRFVDELARRGPSYRRQRAAFADGGMDALLRALVAETRSGNPRF